MEVEQYSCIRNASKSDIETFSCIRNRNNIDKISYIRSPPSNDSFSIPCVPVRTSNHSPRQIDSSVPVNASSSKMVVDLQSQNPCVVTADPSAQSSPHDYKMLPQEVSPRRASQDYKLIQQQMSPQSASHSYKHLQVELSPTTQKHHAQEISPRPLSNDYSQRQQQDQQISPKLSHDHDLVNQNISPPRAASHDYRLLPPESIMTPSPDNPQNIDSDIPHVDNLMPKNDQGNLSPQRSSMDATRFDFDPKRMDLDSMDQNSGSEQSPCQSPEKQRNRRKQTIEDIVRRMKHVEENGYFSNDSDEELIDEDMDGDNSLMGMHPRNMLNGGDKEDRIVGYGQDEVDGAPMQMTGLRLSDLERQPSLHINGVNDRETLAAMTSLERMSYKNGSINMDTENIQPDKNNVDMTDKEGKKSEVNKDISPERLQINAIMDKVAEITGGGGGKYSQDQSCLPKMNSSWFHGAFNSLPLPFPFPSSPLEHHLNPNFLPHLDAKFASPQEVEKDYLKCQYCERTFRRQKNLENHVENTHHGKGTVRRKPEGNQADMYFKCTHCPYTTKHQSNLYVHLRIHTGERPYICGACGVQYSQSHSLKSHIINKHDGIMSYYIKEKRNRSPRGIGYLAHVNVPDMYKIPGQPNMVPPNMTPTHHHHSPPQANSLLMPHNNMPMPPNPQALSALHQQQMMASPHHQGQLQPPMVSPMQKMMMSPQQQQMAGSHGHHQQENKPSPLGQLAENMSQNCTPVSHYSLMQQQQQQQQQQKPSPTFYANGHHSPNYGKNLFHPYKMTPTLAEEQPIPLITNHTPKSQQMPLQEICNNHMNEGDTNHGAIDLTKKMSGHTAVMKEHSSPVTTNPAVDAALKSLEEMSGREIGHDKEHRCIETGGGQCVDCIHANKLRTLRLNVVRMLSILVPNLNFEEKGISAEGDSVDELLHDVIESNMQEEEMSD